MSVLKCVLTPTMRLVFLGVVCGSVLKRFKVPQDKLDKLEVIPHRATDDKSITFAMLEKLAGKYTCMSVAVPPAALYAHYMYRAIGDFRRSGGTRKNTEIAVEPNSGLRFEIDRWLEIRRSMNGSSWCRAAHRMLTLIGATDASSEAWGGPFPTPFGDGRLPRGMSQSPHQRTGGLCVARNTEIVLKGKAATVRRYMYGS